MNRKSFIMYHDTMELLSELTDVEIGRVIKSVFIYDAFGTKPEELNTGERLAFTHIKQYIDRDAASYEEKCKKKAQAGRQGGLKTQSQNRKNKAIAQAAAKPYTDTDTETETETDADTEKESDPEPYIKPLNRKL